MVAATRQFVLFNPGPVNLHPAVRQAAVAADLCHRQPEFETVRAGVVAKLHDAAGLPPDSHRLSLLHGSGTLAVDAALTSLVRGRVLVVDNGVYCERIRTTLAPLAEVHALELDLGHAPDIEDLDDRAGALRPDWVACVHHETTTGLLNPLPEIAATTRRHGARLFVDAVSSLGAHPIDPAADVVCFNSNKCLEGMPGIAGVFWRRELEPQPTVPVLDVDRYVEGVPSTPNVPAFLALDAALDLLAAEDRPARYARLARVVWREGERAFEPLLPETDRSNVLCSFRLGRRDPDVTLRRAHERGYVIYAGQGALRDEIFRVANMGAAIDENVIADLFAVLTE